MFTWAFGSPIALKMTYKAKFQPLEAFIQGAWQPFAPQTTTSK